MSVPSRVDTLLAPSRTFAFFAVSCLALIAMASCDDGNDSDGSGSTGGLAGAPVGPAGGSAALGGAAGTPTNGGAPATGGVTCDPDPEDPCDGATEIGRTCEAGAYTVVGRYYLINNLWGESDGSGQGCAWLTCPSGGGWGWGADFSWTGSTSSVKAYPSIVYGWHWGQKTYACGLPVQLSQRLRIPTQWKYSLTENGNNVMNVAYDLWLSSEKYPTYEDDPTDEVMVWVHRSGSPVPIGGPQETVNLAGGRWNRWHGNAGTWKVFSFVPEQNSNDVSFDLSEFLNHLVDKGLVDGSKYLVSIEAGSEIFTGDGRIDTSLYRVDVPE